MMINFADNTMYAIDLAKDWTNKSVVLGQTEGLPQFRASVHEGLWLSSVSSAIYRFASDSIVEQDSSDPIDPANPLLNRNLSISVFDLNDNDKSTGGGNWTEIVGHSGRYSFTSDIEIAVDGYFCRDDEYAYYLGTLAYTGLETADLGLLRFNLKHPSVATMATDKLRINNTRAFIANIVGYTAKSHFLINASNFGSRGVLVAIGGSPEKINIFDKDKQKWYIQQAEGTVPQELLGYCAVGIQCWGYENFEM